MHNQNKQTHEAQFMSIV